MYWRSVRSSESRRSMSISICSSFIWLESCSCASSVLSAVFAVEFVPGIPGGRSFSAGAGLQSGLP